MELASKSAGSLNPVSCGRQNVGITPALGDGLIVYKTTHFGPALATVACDRGVASGQSVRAMALGLAHTF